MLMCPSFESYTLEEYVTVRTHLISMIFLFRPIFAGTKMVIFRGGGGYGQRGGDMVRGRRGYGQREEVIWLGAGVLKHSKHYKIWSWSRLFLKLCKHIFLFLFSRPKLIPFYKSLE